MKDLMDYQGLVTKKLTWAEETMLCINKLTPSIEGKAFDPDWFLLRQRLEQFEAEAIARNVQPSPDNSTLIQYLARGIWTEWHGPLAKIPSTHDETVQALTRMFSDFSYTEARPVQQPATEPLNINDRVYVRLTAKGIEAQKNHYLRLRLDPAKHIRPAQDGVWEFQLWELMSIFGTEMYMGNTPLFDKNKITLALREPAPVAGQSPTKFIGEVRRSLFLDVDDSWNGVVRDVTAKLEVNEYVDEAEVFKALAQHLRNQALAKGFAENVAQDWAPLAKKLSAQLKSMGADVHPSKLEIWLEQNGALALRDVPQGHSDDLEKVFGEALASAPKSTSWIGYVKHGVEVALAARQVPVGPEGEK